MMGKKLLNIREHILDVLAIACQSGAPVCLLRSRKAHHSEGESQKKTSSSSKIGTRQTFGVEASPLLCVTGISLFHTIRVISALRQQICQLAIPSKRHGKMTKLCKQQRANSTIYELKHQAF